MLKTKGGTRSCQLVRRSSSDTDTQEVLYEYILNKTLKFPVECGACACVFVIRLALGLAQVGFIQIKTKNHKISSASQGKEPNLICNYYCLTRSISRHLSQLTYTRPGSEMLVVLIIVDTQGEKPCELGHFQIFESLHRLPLPLLPLVQAQIQIRTIVAPTGRTKGSAGGHKSNDRARPMSSYFRQMIN